MGTDTTEKGLDSLIMRHMTGSDGFFNDSESQIAEAETLTASHGWFAANPAEADTEEILMTPQTGLRVSLEGQGRTLDRRRAWPRNAALLESLALRGCTCKPVFQPVRLEVTTQTDGRPFLISADFCD
jgi:hypothetical protein